MAAVGEDSSRQDMKKKHAVGKDRRHGGHEVPRGFEPRRVWRDHPAAGGRKCRNIFDSLDSEGLVRHSRGT